ncbi:hypothetical protein B484DRAFT_399617, partial [Ochromonadaceae sp. CCMP2298]
RTYAYYPIVDLSYRSGGFKNQKYTAVLREANALTFSYDITNSVLFVRAKVAKKLKMYCDASTTSPIASARMSPRWATPRTIIALPMQLAPDASPRAIAVGTCVGT